jgi:N-acyl-D-aspartate/D-glutamate deacylase
MTPERAVERCTGEIARWLGLDAGVLAPGKRADVVVLDPTALDDRVEEVHTERIAELDGFERLVRRNDDAVTLVLVGGERAVEGGKPTAELGKKRLGSVLRRVSDARAADVSARAPARV